MNKIMKTKHILSILLIISISTLAADECFFEDLPADVWPSAPAVDTNLITTAVVAYRHAGYDWRKFARFRYERSGDYLNWSHWWKSGKTNENGVAVISYDGGVTWVFNPVAISQWALGYHSRHMKGAALDPGFKIQADHLLSMQGEDGAIRYPFPYQGIPSGWVSAMAQGQAISVWTRAFKLFGDTNYLAAAQKAYAFMLIPAEQGGTLGNLGDIHPSLAHYKMLKEYPVSPDLYVLNGSIFALFGIYDWTEFDPSAQCELEKLGDTIRRVLTYYQGSSYNLNYITYPRPLTVVPSYILVNTMLVWNLDQILPHLDLRKFWREWASMVDQPLDPISLSFQLLGGSNAIVSGWGTNYVRLLTSMDLSQPWTEIPLSNGQQSIQLTTYSPYAYYKVERYFVVIDMFSRNGAFERWINSSTPETWVPVLGGGTVSQEGFIHQRGNYLRVDISTNSMTGVRQKVLDLGRSYRAAFWVKALADGTPFFVYFGTSGAPVASLTAGPTWTKFVVTGTATNPANDFAIMSKTPGATLFLDDLQLWEE